MFMMHWIEKQTDFSDDVARCAAGDGPTMAWIYWRLRETKKQIHVELCFNGRHLDPAENFPVWFQGDIT